MSAHTARFVDSESAPCHCWLCHTSLRRHSDNADILPLPLPSLVPPSDTTIAVFSALNKWETRPYARRQTTLAGSEGRPFDIAAFDFDKIWPGSPDLTPFYDQVNSA